MKVKNEMNMSFVIIGLGVLFFLVNHIQNETMIGILFLITFVFLGLFYLVMARLTALNWLLVSKDPSLVKLLEMDYGELKKKYKEIKKGEKA